MSRRPKTRQARGPLSFKVEISDRQKALSLDRRAIRRLVRRVLQEEAYSKPATVSLSFVDDAEMRTLNERYRNRAATTDVLAFRLNEGPGFDTERTLGEVVISSGRAVVEARRRKVSPRQELYLYVVHGVLHLLGYDDETPSARRQIRRREGELLALAGVLSSKRKAG